MTLRKVNFDKIGQVQIDVLYLRGISDGVDGWWVVQTCMHPDLDVEITHNLRFVSGEPLSDPNWIATQKRVAHQVSAFNDAKGLGISGREAVCLRSEIEPDRARFLIEAPVLKAVRA